MKQSTAEAPSNVVELGSSSRTFIVIKENDVDYLLFSNGRMVSKGDQGTL